MHYHRCFSVSELTLAARPDAASGQGLTLPAGSLRRSGVSGLTRPVDLASVEFCCDQIVLVERWKYKQNE